jgi:hypothetical protein
MGRGDYLSQAGPIKASFKLLGRGGSLAGCMRVPASARRSWWACSWSRRTGVRALRTTSRRYRLDPAPPRRVARARPSMRTKRARGFGTRKRTSARTSTVPTSSARGARTTCDRRAAVAGRIRRTPCPRARRKFKALPRARTSRINRASSRRLQQRSPLVARVKLAREAPRAKAGAAAPRPRDAEDAAAQRRAPAASPAWAVKRARERGRPSLTTQRLRSSTRISFRESCSIVSCSINSIARESPKGQVQSNPPIEADARGQSCDIGARCLLARSITREVPVDAHKCPIRFGSSTFDGCLRDG